MSILDDAIREHLDLKRAHGADDAELKKLEDEAFGPPQRPDEPDPFAEAPTEFLVAPEVGAEEQPDEPSGERRAPNITDLQEAPEAPAPETSQADEPDDGPAEEEHPAMEHETIADAGHSTEERHAIAEQPTEMFDVEGQFEDAATESDAPSDEELVDAELAEPRLAPPEPLSGIEASAAAEAPAEEAAEEEPADEFDEFFSEQRLSDELNQALEAPLPDEPGAPATEETPAVFVDIDVDEEDEAGGEVAFEDEEPSDEHEVAPPEAPPEADDDEPAAPAPGPSHEDVLEDTPEFLEDAPEDDNLWFEQKPPKDFDFDD
jgi:hypothetical protein